MAYQTINPYSEKLLKSFKEDTDAQLEAILAKAEETYENDWSLSSLAARKAIDQPNLQPARGRRCSVTCGPRLHACSSEEPIVRQDPS
jgi:hypothetical protein